MIQIREIDGQREIVVRRGNVEDVYPLPPDADDELIDVMLANIIRMERDRLLAECDYVMMADYPIGEAGRETWAGYRQALRDLPEQVGFPREVNYPAAPRKGEADAD